VMLALALLVCLGRVLALVHTPLDVAGGLVVALIGGLWYWTDIKHVLKKTSQKIK